MISRCTNHSDPSYESYGARGIKVADEWLNYKQFVVDMGERPEGRSIDRIDPFGNYCKENCRWATASQQQRNKRKPGPLIDTPMGAMTVCEAAEVSGISANLLRARRRAGWPANHLFNPINNAFSHPKR